MLRFAAATQQRYSNLVQSGCARRDSLLRCMRRESSGLFAAVGRQLTEPLVNRTPLR